MSTTNLLQNVSIAWVVVFSSLLFFKIREDSLKKYMYLLNGFWIGQLWAFGFKRNIWLVMGFVVISVFLVSYCVKDNIASEFIGVMVLSYSWGNLYLVFVCILFVCLGVWLFRNYNAREVVGGHVPLLVATMSLIIELYLWW